MATATPAALDIQFDKASKFYEPNETVSGTIAVLAADTYIDHGRVSVLAEAFMDTVSAIRGNMGRGPLKPEDRTMFMSKEFTVIEQGKTIIHEPIRFNFPLTPTTDHPLIDAYVGVDFSVVYKVTVTI